MMVTTKFALPPVRKTIDDVITGEDIGWVLLETLDETEDIFRYANRCRNPKPVEVKPIEVEAPNFPSREELLNDYKSKIQYLGTYARNVVSAYFLLRRNLMDYKRFKDGWTQADDKRLFWKEQFSFPTFTKIIGYIPKIVGYLIPGRKK